MITETSPECSAGKIAGRGSSVAVASLLSLIFIGGTAGAYWTTTGAGVGSATTATLGAPTNVVAAALTGTSDTLVIDWDEPTTGTPATGYRVNKDTAAGDLLCSATAPTTTCNATGLLPSGTYDVVVTSLLNNSWTASANAVSGTTNAPAASLDITDPAANATDISTTPTITGTSTTAGTVELAVRLGTATSGDPFASGTATADGTSPWSGTVSPALAHDTQYTITATQTTPGGTSTISKTFTTVAATAPVTVTTTTLPDATQDSAYSTKLAASGGTPPYTWAVSSGSLPAGLTLSSSGLLSGTPTATGPATFSVVATDSVPTASPAQSLTLTVNAPVDTTAPTITGVTSTLTDGTYTVGQLVPITVTFSEAVVVTGTPQLTLETGTTDRLATYSSGSGTSTLTFNYTVQAGDSSSDLDYVGTNSLGLPAASTIKDGADNNAVLTLPTPGGAGSLGANRALRIDTTAPTVTINQAAGQADPTNASPINFTVVFSESVTGFGADDVVLTGTATGATATVTGTGTSYNVAVSGMSEGTVIASVQAGAATDGANISTASTSTDNTVTYDTTGPTVTINQAGDQVDPTNGTSAKFTVVFSSTVTGFTAADVSLSGTATGGTVSVTGSGTTYTVTVTGMTNGTVIVSVPAGGASDGLNTNSASTSTDNTVTRDAVSPTVSAAAATNKTGGTQNRLEAGDTFVIDFSEAVKGLPTSTNVTLSRSGNGSVTLHIPGVFESGVSLGSNTFLDGNGTKNANFNNSTVTVSGSKVTVTLAAHGGDAVGTGGGTGSVTFTPDADITDLAGNAVSGTGTFSRPIF